MSTQVTIRHDARVRRADAALRCLPARLFIHARGLIVVALALTPAAAVGQTLPSGWTATSVGNPSLEGTASFADGVFSVAGAGSDISGKSDQFMFVHQQMTGDGVIVARLTDLLRVHTLTKAGVMIRETLDANASNVFLQLTAGKGVAFQRRPRPSGNTTSSSGGSGSTPIWLRLERRGSTFTASGSDDGRTWTEVGSDTIPMEATVYVGLAATSHNTSAFTIANFSGVDVLGPLSDGWQSSDIGNVAIAGSAWQGARGLVLQGAGTDIGGTADEFRYVYRRASGDTDVVAQLASLEMTNGWAKAGVMIRSGLTADSQNAFMFVTATQGVAFQSRSADGSNTSTYGSAPGQAPGWVKIERRSTLVNAYRSTDGETWTLVASQTLPLKESYYVGLAVTSHDPEEATTALFERTQVATTTTINQAPMVTLTSPAAGTSYLAPAMITLEAGATDLDGTIDRVEFFSGSTLLGSDASAPYSLTWSNVPAGSYSLTAVAHDSGGAVSRSTAVSVTVTATMSNQPPTVSLIAPISGATFVAPASISLSASASDADGTIARVDFYHGTTLIASDTSSPYGTTWSGVGVGTYTLKAVARDNGGAATTSHGVTVTVTNQPPTISLTSPASDATFTAPATIAIAASASDSDGTIARVEFYSGSTLLGSDTSSPYTFSWSNIPAGSYSITAVARDNAGATTVSGARTVTVTASALPKTAVFLPSSNHTTAVTNYVLEIFAAGADPNTAAPAATQDMGKPAVVNGECTADVSQAMLGLTPGTYYATVTAVGSGGSARSAPSPNFVR